MAPPDELAARTETASREMLLRWLGDLARAGRALRLVHADGATLWLAAEHAALVSAAHPDAALEGKVSLLPPAGGTGENAIDREGAILRLVRGWAESSGPFTAGEMAGLLCLSVSDVDTAVAGLENEGLVLRGSFRPGADEEEFCDRRILARIHRATVGRLRREVEPVSQASFLRFLFQWQHAAAGWETAGEGGLLDVIDKLQGFETAAAAWEPELLACRVADYGPELLDRLCTGGEVVWGSFIPK